MSEVSSEAPMSEDHGWVLSFYFANLSGFIAQIVEVFQNLAVERVYALVCHVLVPPRELAF